MKNSINRFTLSFYSLITQVIIINLITAFIGLIFIFLVNFLLISNEKIREKKIDMIEIKKKLINVQMQDITNYLLNNAIFIIPQFNENSGELVYSSIPQLEPYAAQFYIENNYLDQPNEIMIYNDDLIRFVDIKDLYSVDDVIEINTNKYIEKENFIQKYKKYYFQIFYKFEYFFNKKKSIEIIEPAKNDINLIIEAIKKQSNISKFFSHENNLISYNLAQVLIQNNEIHGVVLIRGYLDNETKELALISYNLFNLFITIIFFMFLLSIFFTRSIIRPIRALSSIVKIEQDKFTNINKKIKYPIRNDEIGRLSSDIENMSKELKNQINELEKFAADVAHELKNPLTSVKASNELLFGNKIQLKDRKLLFNNINKDLDRMNKLISDISEYTRTQAEIGKQKFELINLNKLINDIVLSFSNNNKKINIVFDSINYDITILTNPDKLAQVFINLIENAISFSPMDSKILISLGESKEKVFILIIDQGAGIENKLKHKIFERFYSDRQNNQEYYSGLGLSISRVIIESFGGSLELSENQFKDYKGACFEVKLPLIR